jgi:hypothetical protein
VCLLYIGLFAEPDGACADEQGNGDDKEGVIEHLDEGLALNGLFERSAGTILTFDDQTFETDYEVGNDIVGLLRQLGADSLLK